MVFIWNLLSLFVVGARKFHDLIFLEFWEEEQSQMLDEEQGVIRKPHSFLFCCFCYIIFWLVFSTMIISLISLLLVLLSVVLFLPFFFFFFLFVLGVLVFRWRWSESRFWQFFDEYLARNGIFPRGSGHCWSTVNSVCRWQLLLAITCPTRWSWCWCIELHQGDAWQFMANTIRHGSFFYLPRESSGRGKPKGQVTQ